MITTVHMRLASLEVAGARVQFSMQHREALSFLWLNGTSGGVRHLFQLALLVGQSIKYIVANDWQLAINNRS